MINHNFNYVVIGGGLAGLYTAYFLAQKGSVALIAPMAPEVSNSYYAQGGMAAVKDSTDTLQEHYADTMTAGRGLCDPKAVQVLTQEAPERIDELIAMGMQFDTDGEHLALGLEGGHHHKRILHAGGDATGKLVTSFMIGQVKTNPRISILDYHTAYELVVMQGRCYGVEVFNHRTAQIEIYSAQAVVLATGGAGALYKPTTNPPTTLGDGLAMAYRAGVELMDMEFVQFHPTALYRPDGSAFLISEAVRGEGAYLLDQDGKRFMKPIHPLAELAPRDIVARSIFAQMQEQQTPSVRLSLAHLDPEHVLKRFPTIAQKCADFGLDLTREIPVAPAAHYTVGGIRVDLMGATSLTGLYAVGEVSSTGVMGANRLASNSLVECAVFGKRIADHVPPPEAMEFPAELENYHPSLYLQDKEVAWDKNKGDALMLQLGKLLSEKVGIVRNATQLTEAIEQIEKTIKLLDPIAPNNIHAFLIQQRHVVAGLIARAALQRTESRGGHFRSDYPKTLPAKETFHTSITQKEIKHLPLHERTTHSRRAIR